MYAFFGKCVYALEVAADRLLHRKVVGGVIVIVVLSFLGSKVEIIRWINRAAFVTFVLLILLWILVRAFQDEEGQI